MLVTLNFGASITWLCMQLYYLQEIQWGSTPISLILATCSQLACPKSSLFQPKDSKCVAKLVNKGDKDQSHYFMCPLATTNPRHFPIKSAHKQFPWCIWQSMYLAPSSRTIFPSIFQQFYHLPQLNNECLLFKIQRGQSGMFWWPSPIFVDCKAGW